MPPLISDPEVESSTSIAVQFRMKRSGHGFHTVEVDDFRAFISLIGNLFLDNSDFVWRGCRNPDWHLISTLTRTLGTRDHSEDSNWDRRASYITTKHLRNFLVEIRGIYKLSAEHQVLLGTLEKLLAEKERSFTSVLGQLPSSSLPVVFELFAIGQHYGLATPLLDWTASPYVALHFAFEQNDARLDDVGYRVVYALNRRLLEEQCPVSEALNDNSVRFIESLAFQNPRLVAQGGIFTFSPTHISLEDWVTRTYKHDPQRPVLLRFLIRNKDRKVCLAWLDKMNIGFRSLFPEFEGAAKLCNYKLEQLPL